MAALVGAEGVIRIGVAQRVPDQSGLSMIQVRPAQHALDFALLRHLAAQVIAQLLDRPEDHPQLVQSEIGGVSLVGLGVDEGATVLHGCLTQNPRDGKELCEPVPAMEHRPVKQGASRPAIAILERVVVS